MWKHPLSLVDVRGRVYVLNVVLYCIVSYCIEGGAAGWVGVGVASIPTCTQEAMHGPACIWLAGAPHSN